MLLSASAFAQSLPLIPRRKDLQMGEGDFAFSAETAIRFDRQLVVETELLAEKIERLTGQKTVAEELRIHLASEISLDPDAGLRCNRMTVTPGGVKIVGKDAAGAFAGAQEFWLILHEIIIE